MDSSTFGEYFRFVSFGESHGPAVGVVLDGVRPGLSLSPEMIQEDLNRRRPGMNAFSSARREADRVEVLSGVFEGVTTGSPIALLIRNVDARPEDYAAMRDNFRPGHADFTWLRKYGIRDWRGGGRASGRITAGWVSAGAVARRLLAPLGIEVYGQVVAVETVETTFGDPAVARDHPLHVADPSAAERMERAILEAKREGDSVGAAIELRASGVPVGLGDPVFRRLDGAIAQALMSIGGVKGIEIGDGFAAARARGSDHNDEMSSTGWCSNHAGGVLGGVSTGQPIIVRLAVKPTSSIPRPQTTLDTSGREVRITSDGRHDPCLGPRIVPVAEAMLLSVLADAWLRQQSLLETPPGIDMFRAAIDAADRDILEALSYRTRVVEALARWKDAHHIIVRDPEREREVARRWADQALDLGVDPEFASQILRCVTESSVGLQERMVRSHRDSR